MKREDVEVGDYVRCEDSIGCVYIGRVFLKQEYDALVQILRLEETSERGAKGSFFACHASGKHPQEMADAFGGDTDYYKGKLYSVADYDSCGSKEWMVIVYWTDPLFPKAHSAPSAKPAVKS